MATTDQLWQVLNSLGDSSQFCTAGSFSPVLPGFEVEGIGNIGLPISAADAKRLVKQASQAPYGRGEETIVDTNVRRVWQLEPRQFTLNNAAWADFMNRTVDAVQKEFGMAKEVQHELYKLLVYEKGSFFAPHRDTEKIPGMFATLIVCLPSRHAGGTLIVTHDGVSKRIDFAGDKSEFEIQYAAFYADCRHEITPVTSGYRVCLVYNLAIAKQEQQPSAPAHAPAVEAVAELLPQSFADKSRDKLVIPFEHQYTEAALDPRELKGADRSRLAVLVRAAEGLGYQVFVALLTHFQSGSPDYNTISYRPSRRRYRRFDSGWDDDISGEDDGAQFEEVYDEQRSLDHWLDPQGRPQAFGTLVFDEEEIVGTGTEQDWAYTQQISEATGNEGATLERQYRHAVAVIWPRERFFRILAREGQEHAVAALEELVARTDEPENDDDCRTFATEIIGRWKKRARFSYPRPLQEALPSRMLILLDRLGAIDLAARFVSEILADDSDGNEGPVLVRLGSRLGWEPLREPLRKYFVKQVPSDYSSNFAPPVKTFEGLCCSPPDMTDERRAICLALADEVERMIERFDASAVQPLRSEESRKEIVVSIFRALTALSDDGHLERFIEHLRATPLRYGLRDVLIPAMKSIRAEVDSVSLGGRSFERLLRHCLAELRTLTATRIAPPADWSREGDMSCSCADCRELVRFLHDPNEQVHRFRRLKKIRDHLSSQIKTHRLDLTSVTDRKGSPQSLVCTKTQATYERRRAQFENDLQLLRELETFAGSDVT